MNPQALKTLYIVFVLVFFATVALTEAAESEYSGEVTLENRYYPSEGQFGNTDKLETSLVLRPEYSIAWDDDRKVVTIIPFAVLSLPDSDKTHFDLREASYVAAYENIELRAGISKVYWGVTESQHLVDVINQSDSVLNSDGEDKLGQPMINTTLISSYGNLDLFILPYFRERTFSGKEGRFRGPLLIDTDNPLYEDSDEENNIDFAGRYTSTFADLDLGLSIFHGTDREPIFVPNSSLTALRPKYIQTTQVGVDAQYVFESWLFKFEGIRKQADLREDYTALTSGFEYTFSNIKNTGLDIGVIAEYLFDSRDAGALFSNHTFVGSRFALNDEQSTEFLGGGIVNNENGDLTSLRIEGSRRINENWKWEVEASTILQTQPTDILSTYKDDDYLQLSLSYYF